MDVAVNRDATSSHRLRVRYSTIVNYISFIYRLIVSIGFSTIVIRRLSIDEYGLFTTLFAVYGLFTPLTSLWMTWTYRIYVRRGVTEVVKTGHTLSLIYSLIAGILTIIFTLTIPYVNVIYRYSAVLILIIVGVTEVFRVLYQVYSLFILGYRPYVIGYTSLLSETIRFISALIFVYFLGLGLMGALIAVFLTFISAYIMFLYFMFRENIPWPGLGLYKNALKLFVKNSYISLMNIIRQQINSSGEKLLTGLASASPVYPAYLGIAGISRRLISGGGAPLIRSLSPSLLRRPNRSDIEDILRITILIMGFMIGVVVVYAKTIISIFNPIYMNGLILFIIYAFVPLTEIFVSLFSVIGTASDRTDMYTSGLKLRRSLLFKNSFTLLLGTIAKFLSGALLFIILYFGIGIRDIYILVVFPLSSIIIYAYIMYIFYKRSRQLVEYSIPSREIFASILGIIGIFIPAYITGLNNYTVSRISRDYPAILLIATQSIIVYLAVIYVVSPWVRKFLSRGYAMIRERILRSEKYVGIEDSD